MPPQLFCNQNIIAIRKKILLKTWIIQNEDWFQLQPVGTINNGAAAFSLAKSIMPSNAAKWLWSREAIFYWYL